MSCGRGSPSAKWGAIVELMHDCLGKIDVSLGRGIGFSPLDCKSWAYGVIVGRAFRDEHQSREDFMASFAPAWTHYQAWFREQSIATFYGLPESSPLHRFPAWAHVLPWGERSPKEMMRWLPPRIRRNRNFHGARIPAWRGRAKIMRLDSLASTDSHGKQFFELSKAVCSQGFWDKCNLEDPFRVWLLARGEETRWLVYSGNHRVAAIVANGLQSVHAELQARVVEEDVSRWPNVANQSFTEDEALKIFDNLWNGVLNESTARMISSLPGIKTA